MESLAPMVKKDLLESLAKMVKMEVKDFKESLAKMVH